MSSPASLITLMLAEDHNVVRQGLVSLLKSEGCYKLVGEARNGREAVKLAAELNPDVILMDIAMPLLNGFEATRQILAANPAAKVVILSAYSEEVYVERMIDAGAVGFLEKQTSAEILTKALGEVAAGRSFFSPAIAKRLGLTDGKPRDRTGKVKPNSRRLTDREHQVLQLVAEGAANKQMADELGISIKTVEKHRQHVMDKLKIHDTAGLTRYAIRHGVIENGVPLEIV